jgi:hypothetical protein
MIMEYQKEFRGLPVVTFPAHPDSAMPEVRGEVAWRIDCGFDDDDNDSWDDEWLDFEDVWERFLATVDTTQVTALTVGHWSDYLADADYPLTEALAAAAARLPALRALHLGDVDNGSDWSTDISTVHHGDLTPVLQAYPALEELWVSGRSHRDAQPYFEPLRHSTLRKLVLVSGGLSAATIRAVGECEFPLLRYLDIHFGSPTYGGDGTLADIDWLISGEHFQNLTHLGLRDSVFQDEIAAEAAHAPIVAQLKTLDLSLGTLGDEGAAALLAGQPLNHLTKLDLHHHFISTEMQDRLRTAWPGVDVDLSQLKTEYNGRRYVAVAE